MLQISSNLDKAFDALLDTYAGLGASLPLISAIDTLFTSNPFIQDTLIHVYKDVLTFHHRALRFFKKRGRAFYQRAAGRVLIQMCRLANCPQVGNTTLRWAF
jgi:NADH:ubiquinone oxidoreductase subunit E